MGTLITLGKIQAEVACSLTVAWGCLGEVAKVPVAAVMRKTNETMNFIIVIDFFVELVER